MYLALAVVVVVGAIVVALAATNSSGSGDLEKQVQALTQRVTQLESQIQALRGSAGAGLGNVELERQANAELQKIYQLVSDGQIDQAKAALPDFNAKFASTKVGQGGQSLARELAVVGKTAPTDWNIEKWFQG